jgi:Golgi phosphoprotein 3 (GPP34)
MLLAEELLLLVTDNISGRLCAPAAQVDVALGGAILLELVLAKKVDLSGQWDVGRPGRIIVRDFSPAGDEVLDAAVKTAGAHQGKKPSAVIRPLSKGLRRTLYDRLALAGVVRAEQRRILGIVAADTWPVHDVSRKAQVCNLVTQALVRQTASPAPGAALVVLVHALKYEHKIVDPRDCGMSRQQLRARAEQIAGGNWAPDAIRPAIGEITAAVLAVTSAAAAAGSVTWDQETAE